MIPSNKNVLRRGECKAGSELNRGIDILERKKNRLTFAKEKGPISVAYF